MKNIYDILSKIDFEKRCEQYALGFQRDTDTPTMTKFRQESMKEFCFSLIQEFYEIVLQDNWQERTAPEQKKSAFVHNKIEFPEFNDNLLEEFDKQFFENGQDDDLTETTLEQKDVK